MSNLSENETPISILPLFPGLKLSFNNGIPVNTVFTITNVNGINKAFPILEGRPPCDVRVNDEGKVSFHPLNSTSDDESVITSEDNYLSAEDDDYNLSGDDSSNESF